MKTTQNNGRGLTEADAAELEQEELKYFENEKAILDAPLTNRAFLAGIAYLAEAVQCGDSDFSKRAMRENFENLRDVFVGNVERAEREIEECEREIAKGAK
jgi:hypothetical protein